MLRDLRNNGGDETHVFFGQLWLPVDMGKALLADNLTSLDCSGAFGGTPIIGYRWTGEGELCKENFITGHAA